MVCTYLFGKLQKIWAVICVNAIFQFFSVCYGDLDILCSGLFSHLVKLVVLSLFPSCGLCKWLAPKISVRSGVGRQWGKIDWSQNSDWNWRGRGRGGYTCKICHQKLILPTLFTYVFALSIKATERITDCTGVKHFAVLAITNLSRIRSVSRVLDCRVGGHRLDSQGRTITRGLK